jgi:hypothetical protein
MAPDVLASISNSREIRTRSSLSNNRFRLSKVRVTDSSEVVPNSIEIAATPGRSFRTLSSPSPDPIKTFLSRQAGK